MVVADLASDGGIDEGVSSRRLRDWVWSPVYAKLWWTVAVLYWAMRMFFQDVPELAWMSEPGFSGYLVILFSPPIMLLILSFRVMKSALKDISTGDDMPVKDDCAHDLYENGRGPSGLPIQFDPLAPRAGAFWIGSALNPLNPGYVNRGS